MSTATTWRLTGKPAGGGQCEHCPRALVHRYEVTSSTGVKMTVGRGCLKKVTGWTFTAAQAEREIRMIRIRAERAANWAVFAEAHPGVAAVILTDVDDYCARVPRECGFGGGVASEVKLNLESGSPAWMAERYMETRERVTADLHRMFPHIRYVRDDAGAWQPVN